MGEVVLGMSLEELERYQYANRVNYLASLFRNAAQQFLDAARLLEIKSPAISRLHEAKIGRIEVTPLLPLYDVIIERYNDEFFSPQVYHSPSCKA